MNKNLETLIEAAKYLERLDVPTEIELEHFGDHDYHRRNHDYHYNPLQSFGSEPMIESKFTNGTGGNGRRVSAEIPIKKANGDRRPRTLSQVSVSPGKSSIDSMDSGIVMASYPRPPSASSSCLSLSPGSIATSNGGGSVAGGGGGCSSGNGSGRIRRNSRSFDPAASSRHRELHKNLEKNRRAQLRTCFDELRKTLPKQEYSYKKSSNINIIHSAIKYIGELKRESVDKSGEVERLTQSVLQKRHKYEQLKMNPLFSL